MIAFETANKLQTDADSEVISNLLTCYLDDGKSQKASKLVEQNLENIDNEIRYIVMDNICEAIYGNFLSLDELGEKTKEAVFNHLSGEWDALAKSVKEVDGWSMISDHPNNIFLQSVSNFQMELSQIDLRDFFISQGDENETILVLEYRNEVQMILTPNDIGISIEPPEPDLADFPDMIGILEIRNKLIEIAAHQDDKETFKENYLTLMMMRNALNDFGALGVRNLDAERETVEALLLKLSVDSLN